MTSPVTGLADLFGARAAAVVPDAIGAGEAARVRARLARAGLERYALVDRGSYAWTDDVDEPALVGALAAIAADLTGAALETESVRAVRLVAGDYLLAHHDLFVHAGSPHDDRTVELVLDLSAAATPGAEVHYRRHGRLFHRVASQPGALSVVERDAAITCHHTYVSRRHTSAEVTRLVVRLRVSDGGRDQ